MERLHYQCESGPSCFLWQPLRCFLPLPTFNLWVSQSSMCCQVSVQPSSTWLCWHCAVASVSLCGSDQREMTLLPSSTGWRGVQARGQRTWPLSGLVFHTALQRGSLTFCLVCSRELQTWGSDRCVQVQAETDKAWRRVAFKRLFKCILRKIRSLFFIICDLMAGSVTTVSYMKTSSWSIYSLFYNEFICWTTWVG